jgi:hypothetical protein
VLDRHESLSADWTAGLYDMLAGLVGPEDVEENEDDFTDMAMPSWGECVSREGPVRCGLGTCCDDDAELKGLSTARALVPERTAAVGLKRSPPD